MNQIEKNIMNSFRLAKRDIIKLQNEFIKLSQTQERLAEMINKINSNELKLYKKLKNSQSKKPKNSRKPKTKTIVKTITKKAPKIYVSSKDSNKFHLSNCPFAKNIKPKHKETYKSKSKALNKGLKPCKCVA